MHRGSPIWRITSWLSLLGYVLVASGLPLPITGPSDTTQAVAGKDRSKPFPCMDKPCGCATAEQCFASCCCHTPAEQLAWAKAHRVDVAILTVLERRVATKSACASGHHAKKAASCCRTSHTVDLEGPDICSEYRSLAADPADPQPSDDEATAEDQEVPGRVVILRSMLACQGIAAAWAAATVSLPPPPPAAGEFQPPQCVAWLVIVDQLSVNERLPPDTPPPRA